MNNSEQIDADDKEFFSAARRRLDEAVQNVEAAIRKQFEIPNPAELAAAPPQTTAQTVAAEPETKNLDAIRRQIDEATRHQPPNKPLYGKAA